MKNYDSIICNSEKEITECAKFLIKKGYKICNYNEGNELFKTDISFIGEWKGLTRIGNNEWIRFFPQNWEDKKTIINFNVLLREEKLNKIYGKRME
jgi:hypothetical protein